MDIIAIWDAVRPWWLVWLVLLFGGIAFWAFRPRNKRRFEDDANIPFKDEDNGG